MIIGIQPTVMTVCNVSTGLESHTVGPWNSFESCTIWMPIGCGRHAHRVGRHRWTVISPWRYYDVSPLVPHSSRVRWSRDIPKSCVEPVLCLVGECHDECDYTIGMVVTTLLTVANVNLNPAIKCYHPKFNDIHVIQVRVTATILPVISSATRVSLVRRYR
jgi:hypothetical protein